MEQLLNVKFHTPQHILKWRACLTVDDHTSIVLCWNSQLIHLVLSRKCLLWTKRKAKIKYHIWNTVEETTGRLMLVWNFFFVSVSRIHPWICGTFSLYPVYSSHIKISSYTCNKCFSFSNSTTSTFWISELQSATWWSIRNLLFKWSVCVPWRNIYFWKHSALSETC